MSAVRIIHVRQPGVVAACSSRPLLSQDWLACHLPSVREVRVVEAPVIDKHERACRRLEVVLRPGAETYVVDAEVDVISILVRHDIGCDNESPSSKRSRQRANWDAEERAVRAADTRAAADHRLRERSRKALKREADAVIQYELAASLPATQPPPADKAWALPSDQRPRYVGEYVWVTHSQQLQQPRLGMVLAVWQNGCCDIQLLSVTSPAIATPVAVMATSTALVPVNSACSHAVATIAVTSTADRNAAVSIVAMPVASMPIAADGYMISAHGLQLVPLGDELLPWSGIWTGRLRDPRLGYHGEMGCIRGSGPASSLLPHWAALADRFAITDCGFPDGSRSLLLFDPRTMAFDGEMLTLPAPTENLGPDMQRFEGVSNERAISIMAFSAATSALREHHQAELERLHPLMPADLEPLPCSCKPYCTAHALGISEAVCLWYAGPLQSARHSVQDGWRNSTAMKWCDLCPFERAEIPPGARRLDCYKCDFDVCEGCARASTRTCQESGCSFLQHRFTCDSKKTAAQRFPERQALIKQQLGELQSLQPTQSPSDLAQQLESLGISGELSARMRTLHHLYLSSLEAEGEAICRQGLITNCSFLQEMQPACENRAPNSLKRRGEKRAMWQMSETERAKSSQSHSLRVWREGVVGF